MLPVYKRPGASLCKGHTRFAADTTAFDQLCKSPSTGLNRKMLRSLTVLLLVLVATTTVEAVYDPLTSSAFLSAGSFAGAGYGGYGYAPTLGVPGVASIGVPGVSFAGAFPGVLQSGASVREPSLMLQCRTPTMEVTIMERNSGSHLNAFSAFTGSLFAKQQQQGLNASFEFRIPPTEGNYGIHEASLMIVEFGPGESLDCNGMEMGPGLSPKKKGSTGIAGINALSSLNYGYAAQAALSPVVGSFLGGVANPFAFSNGKVRTASNRRQQGDGLIATIDNPGSQRQVVRINKLEQYKSLAEVAGRTAILCPTRVVMGLGGKAECRSREMPGCCTLGYVSTESRESFEEY